MGFGVNGSDDIYIKLSMDISDIQKELSKLQSEVSNSMNDLKNEFSKSSNGLDKLGDSVKELRNDVNKNFDKMENTAKETASSMVSSMTNGFSKITRGAKTLAGVITSIVSIREVFNFGKDIIETSAELDAMRSMFNQVFSVMDESGNEVKNFSGQARKEINKMAQEFKMNTHRLEKDYASFSSQFLGLGLDMEDSIKMSTDALTMAADASAMYDMSLEEAIEHMRSFIKGNYIGKLLPLIIVI